MTIDTSDTTTEIQHVQLDITGMTCASCANRIERRLNKVPGVAASVNYATEKADVRYPSEVSLDQLIDAVRAAGYSAAVPSSTNEDDDADANALRSRLIVSAVLAVPVIALAMIPAIQFDYWQWACLVLATPVVFWAAWPFHRAALVNLRHGASTMDTLVSVGTLAAYGWSLFALIFTDAGRRGTHDSFRFTV